jgi:flagellar biosynthesis protein FlhG
MGERRLGSSVNQYLNKEVDSLEEIMVETAYGPLLIGGDSSELGAANIPFARKIKLLRALRALDADFVVIDLGGDISYNILDFFLAADYHIVLCTPEPAAYLDAYRFIKVALYRKLARLFGVESEFQPMRDLELEELLQRATAPQGDIQIKRIDQLLELVRSEQPQHLRLVQEAIASFNPMLVLNRVGPNQNPDPIVGTVTNVSRQMLSVDVEYLGYIPYSSEMEHSAIELVPVVARYPDGEIAATISEIIA